MFSCRNMQGQNAHHRGLISFVFSSSLPTLCRSFIGAVGQHYMQYHGGAPSPYLHYGYQGVPMAGVALPYPYHPLQGLGVQPPHIHIQVRGSASPAADAAADGRRWCGGAPRCVEESVSPQERRGPTCLSSSAPADA